jgi:hypothetical protein
MCTSKRNSASGLAGQYDSICDHWFDSRKSISSLECGNGVEYSNHKWPGPDHRSSWRVLSAGNRTQYGRAGSSDVSGLRNAGN